MAVVSASSAKRPRSHIVHEKEKIGKLLVLVETA